MSSGQSRITMIPSPALVMDGKCHNNWPARLYLYEYLRLYAFCISCLRLIALAICLWAMNYKETKSRFVNVLFSISCMNSVNRSQGLRLKHIDTLSAIVAAHRRYYAVVQGAFQGEELQTTRKKLLMYLLFASLPTVCPRPNGGV